MQRRSYGCGQRLREQRRDGIADLTAGRIHCSAEHETVRKRLEPRGFPHGDRACLPAVVVNMAVAVLAEVSHQGTGRLVAPHLPPFVRKFGGVVRRDDRDFEPFILGRARFADDALASERRQPFFEHIEGVLIRLRILIAGVQAREQTDNRAADTG